MALDSPAQLVGEGVCGQGFGGGGVFTEGTHISAEDGIDQGLGVNLVAAARGSVFEGGFYGLIYKRAARYWHRVLLVRSALHRLEHEIVFEKLSDDLHFFVAERPGQCF